MESLPDRFIYQDTTARAVSVDTAGMLEALRRVYGAGALAAELAPAP
ncbi:MAG: S46 family peptidase [Polyangiaceae bacterium]